MARPPSQHVRHHAAPRISANELARYMVAGGTGKMGIIKRAKEAKSAVTARYDRVRSDIRNYLCNLGRSRSDLAALQNKYDRLANDPSASVWSREDAKLSVDVLASLARMENQIAGSRFVAAPEKQAPLSIGGVSVSIQLNVLALRERGTQTEVGGVLFRMTKADDETENAAVKRREIGSYAATLALMQTQAKHAKEAQVHHQLCASFDIQCEEVHHAPRTYVSRAKDIENECRFIAAMWNDA